MWREDATRAAAGEIARIFPACNDEKYGEPRQTRFTGISRNPQHGPALVPGESKQL
jgi:hypothetical protein